MTFLFIILGIILGIIFSLLLVFVIRAIMCKSKARALKPEKENVSPEKAREYAERLAEMIRCKTVSVENSYDDAEFAKLRSVTEKLFPTFFAKAEKLTFSDDCWIFKLVGKDTSRNIMVMSHHDVVEAEGDWEHEPFGGEIIDGNIWGRGTVDTKTPLFAEFTALDELLSEGWEPPCNVWLGSSHNEELGGDGIPKALEYFIQNNVSFELILDEGGGIIEAPMAGISCHCAMMAIHEKGRFRAECTAEEGYSHAGLAANPETPVVRTSRFITDVNSKNIFIRKLYPEVKAMFEGLAPYSVFPMRLVFANLWFFSPILKVLIPKINDQAASMLGTMCSFTDISGGSKQKKCVSTASLRFVNDEDFKTDYENFKKVAEKYGVTVTEAKTGNEYHRPGDFTLPQFEYVKTCIGKVFPHVAATPFILPAGTDARHFSDICRCVVRFAPIEINNQQYASVHSPNENISVKAVGNAVAFYKLLLKEYK